jgi:hypothetical protein
MIIKDWNIEAMTGYHPITSFYSDFSIADKFGKSAILDTYNRAFNEWKHDSQYLTEFVMVMNWKMWEHESDAFCKVYYDLYIKASTYAMKNLKGEELEYYFRTTD